MIDYLTDSWVLPALLGRELRWYSDLPGLHFRFEPGVCTCVFDGEEIPIRIDQVDPANVYDSVYIAFRNALGESFSSYTPWARGRIGTSIDCRIMANKVARKAERLPLFQTWLVLNA